VLAALPPALLAEARLLRERAMSQLQSRNIFGLSHRLGGRRNIMEIASRGISDAIDRAVGSGLEAGRKTASSTTISSGNQGKVEEGKPLVDTPALKAILRLLRLAQVCLTCT
jgi:E3 ubiquitin-protein ligase HUWE1